MSGSCRIIHSHDKNRANHLHEEINVHTCCARGFYEAVAIDGIPAAARGSSGQTKPGDSTTMSWAHALLVNHARA
jgi:hypothetical protein